MTRITLSHTPLRLASCASPRRRLRHLPGALFILVAAATANATENSASGQFSGSRLKLDIEGAYSFWAKGGVSGNEPVIRVAVSNSKLSAAVFDAWYDRQYAIDQIIVDDQNKVVFLDFEASGKYRGLSYYFGSGDGCGYCYDTTVRATVRVDGGRFQGKVIFRGRDGPLAFDIDFDVAVPSKAWGDALPRDGGDPGRAYLAYHKAIVALDPKAVAAAMDARSRAVLADYEKEDKLEQVLQYRWNDIHYGMKKVAIVGGFVRGEQAVVLFDGGSTTIEKMYGEATMRREGGIWRVDDELLQVGTR